MKPNPLWRRYARLLGPDPAADIRDELGFHLESKIDDLIAQGSSPEAARQQAERQLGATYSADAFEEFRTQSRAYQDVTGYFAFSTADNLRLTGLNEPEPATGIAVIGNFFQVLGVQPAMGRLFTPDEVRGGPQAVALLANMYWRRQFNADPAIIGKGIELNGTLVTVVGVLPASFDFGAVFSPGAKVDLFTPLDLNQARDWGNIVTLFGRLKPGVTVAQALDDAKRVAPDIYFSVKYPETRGRYKGNLIPVPLKDHVTGKLRRSLTALGAPWANCLLKVSCCVSRGRPSGSAWLPY
jgi:hypothetical protein